jgi:hypothetical protein
MLSYVGESGSPTGPHTRQNTHHIWVLHSQSAKGREIKRERPIPPSERLEVNLAGRVDAARFLLHSRLSEVPKRDRLADALVPHKRKHVARVDMAVRIPASAA